MTDEAHAQLRLVEASARHAEVVGVYLADMKAGADGPEPTHFREAFRRKGPSNYAHGKQAEL
ncbi:sulfite reductase [Antarctobacter heliothermus]|uniref:Sulfite reductase n=2 Tax=Antarctobacter heliothermus TaxID=74033 RepID=A0A222E6R3_9RHOB|nr:sulfite reductase [Antarctobacter heliothermus]|tara:strand:+ start:9362 stop:9547 length:186 start_codon:yes stop_codon:yes gene_type:complete